MNFLYSDGPIIACSTCTHANAAIGIIRISGFTLLSDFAPFFIKNLCGPIEPRKVYYTQLVLQGQVIDDVCFTFFKGPQSYNGENILELSVHGNILNIERIINLFVEHAGCRSASAGEFTFRALKNKKLTLSQVEGLDLLLNASSSYGLNQGLSLLSGDLHEVYREIYELFVIHKSSLELSIDFSDDIGEEAAHDYYHSSLAQFAAKFHLLAKRVSPMGPDLIRPAIVLVGLPNSGKSSLFNHLLSEQRAIVSSIPGTTRDYLTETLVIEGVRYELVDTAGIRQSSDLIEAEGVKRTFQKLGHSFFSILLINPFELVEGFSDLLFNKFDLVFFTHQDMPGFAAQRDKVLAAYPEIGPTGAVNLLDVAVDWDEILFSEINKKYLQEISSNPVLLDRHKSLILKANSLIVSYHKLSADERDVAILSQELNAIGHCISELIGIVSPDQVLNSIFSNFCIGK